MNEFPIGYMINPRLNINKAFIEQVDKCMNNKFVPITQLFIRETSPKNKTIVSAVLMFYETRKSPKKAFNVLSCVIYNIINNYVCIDYLACESKILSELPVDSGGGLKHGNKTFGGYNAIFVNEPNLLSWIFEEQRFCFHIEMY